MNSFAVHITDPAGKKLFTAVLDAKSKTEASVLYALLANAHPKCSIKMMGRGAGAWEVVKQDVAKEL